MKVAIIDKQNKKVSDFELNIAEDIRDDIFKKAVDAEVSMFRQHSGADPKAGKRHSINVSKRRSVFRSTYGKSGSRTPKKTMWRRGMQMRFVGAFAGNTVGGRKAHAPKSTKIILKDINNKVWSKALKIGFVASMNKDLVSSNGQKVPETYPLIIDESVETLVKTKDFKSFLETAGFSSELSRLEVVKVRAGKGTMRNRKYKTKRGPLVVVSSIESPLLKACKSLQGFDVVIPELLMVSDFGMSQKPGRAVIFTKDAMEEFVGGFN